MKYILLTNKPWHDQLFDELSQRSGEEWIRIKTKEDFTVSILQQIEPDLIFIPHWSYIIPSKIFQKFECIVFHMTDLPFGRGGSPLQNLIANGHTDTKISAIRVEKGLDTGPVYLKSPLSLIGTAKEIFLRSSVVIKKMIEEIISKNLEPFPQKGEVVSFNRRKPEQGNIGEIDNFQQVFDFIRMLDCEGYPPAFLETKIFRFEFTRASLISEKEILADVRIIKK